MQIIPAAQNLETPRKALFSRKVSPHWLTNCQTGTLSLVRKQEEKGPANVTRLSTFQIHEPTSKGIHRRIQVCKRNISPTSGQY